MKSNIPRPDEALTDPRTGRINRTWYRFLANLFTDAETTETDAGGGSGTVVNQTFLEMQISTAIQMAAQSLNAQFGARITQAEQAISNLEMQPQLNLGALLDTLPDDDGAGSEIWVPLVDGSEPPNFITDGAGKLIFVTWTP